MRQVAIIVEGQTEEAFVGQVLGPYLGTDIHLQPIITHTRRAADGTAHRGGGGWSGYRSLLQRLVPQPHWSLVTTLIDFYAYPADAPGRNCHTVGEHTPTLCVRRRAAAMQETVPGDWLPFIALHEMETLVIASGSLQATVLGDARAPGVFERIIREAGDAEHIDDGPQTAPSRRVLEALPGYRKAQDAVAVLQGHDLGEALAKCPGIARWVERLRG